MAKRKNNNSFHGKTINHRASMDKEVKSICDILRRDKAKGVRIPMDRAKISNLSN